MTSKHASPGEAQADVLRLATPSDADRIAAFLAAQARTPERRCLFAWSGESESVLARNLASSIGSRAVWALWFRGEHLRGSMGCAFKEGGTHGWLRGPVITEGDFHAGGTVLAQRIMQACPPLGSLSGFPDTQNLNLCSFLTAMGLAPVGGPAHVYRGDCARLAATDGNLRRPDAGQWPSFESLFLSLFPALAHMPARLHDQRDGELLLTSTEGQQTRGFVVARRRGDDAELVALGVHPAARRTGLGERLLRAAMAWATAADIATMALTVLDGATSAVRLYERLGLRRIGTGLDYRAQAD